METTLNTEENYTMIQTQGEGIDRMNTDHHGQQDGNQNVTLDTERSETEVPIGRPAGLKTTPDAACCMEKGTRQGAQTQRKVTDGTDTALEGSKGGKERRVR